MQFAAMYFQSNAHIPSMAPERNFSFHRTSPGKVGIAKSYASRHILFLEDVTVMAKIKNDLETAVQEEAARLIPKDTGTSQAAAAIKSSLSSAMSRLAGSSFLSSKLPMDKVTSMAAGLMSEKKRAFCHCPICRTDVLALALTKLPPCYCRGEHFGIASEKVGKKDLEKAVQAAIHRIRLRPKHPERLPVTDPSKILLVNFKLNVASRLVSPILHKIPESCGCELCRYDTLAYGLNQTPSRYGTSIAGKLRLPGSELEFIKHELVKTIAEAARKVATNPRHREKGAL